MQRDTVKVFKALSDPNRIRIVKMLEGRKLCVCEIRDVLGLSTSTVSQHLSVLRDAELIVDSKDGKWVNFHVNDRSDKTFVRSQLALVKSSFTDDAQVLSDRKRVKKADRNSICGSGESS
jgi:ArsR family transcriptional regulator